MCRSKTKLVVVQLCFILLFAIVAVNKTIAIANAILFLFLLYFIFSYTSIVVYFWNEVVDKKIMIIYYKDCCRFCEMKRRKRSHIGMRACACIHKHNCASRSLIHSIARLHIYICKFVEIIKPQWKTKQNKQIKTATTAPKQSPDKCVFCVSNHMSTVYSHANKNNHTT